MSHPKLPHRRRPPNDGARWRASRLHGEARRERCGCVPAWFRVPWARRPRRGESLSNEMMSSGDQGLLVDGVSGGMSQAEGGRRYG